MRAFLLAMVLNPDVYSKAQAEIDRVVGNGRLPNRGDRDALPYIECVLREVYRYVATPHLSHSPCAAALFDEHCKVALRSAIRFRIST